MYFPNCQRCIPSTSIVFWAYFVLFALGASGSLFPSKRYKSPRSHFAQDTSYIDTATALNSALREKAKLFGLSPEQHQNVRAMLKAVNSLMTQRLGLAKQDDPRSGTPMLETALPDQRVEMDVYGRHRTLGAVAKHPGGFERRLQMNGELKPDRVKAPHQKHHQSPRRHEPPSSAKFKKALASYVVSKKLHYYRTKLHKDLETQTGRFLDDIWSENVNQAGSDDYFQGDIMLWPDQAEEILEKIQHSQDHRRKRKFIRPQVRKWPTGQPIEYSFDGSHSRKEQEYIELALQHWQNITCLDFVRTDSPPTGNRIVFTDVDGCASNVGRHPLGEPQFVSIAQECLRLGVIAHELAHALGFWHEQSRPDRDDFVTVMWNNIEFGSAGQFVKEMIEDVDSNGISYDYGSIMHYRSKAFTRSDALFTIQTNIADYQRTIGQRDQLSFNDIKLMNSMYCQATCPQALPCQRGGYTDPRKCHRCRCPDGFTGRYCESVMSGYGATCGGVVEVTSSGAILASPEYPEYFKKGQECSWLIRAPAGSHIEFQFTDVFDLYCKVPHSLCMDYVEIRNSSDFANTGMRYCCYTTPPSRIYSETDELLVLFRSFYHKGRGFKGIARAVKPSGLWSSWGSWSECTASCGGCGTRIRYRDCSDDVCPGKSVETGACNDQPCDACEAPTKRVVPCGLWGLFGCEKETTSFIPCEGQCCSGHELQGDRCVLSGDGG